MVHWARLTFHTRCVGEEGGRSQLHVPGTPRTLPEAFNNCWTSRFLNSICGILFLIVTPIDLHKKSN